MFIGEVGEIAMILTQLEDSFPYGRNLLMDHPLPQSSEISQSDVKGSLGKKDEELCLICGDRASGYHYNALSCEGCKGFFRRSITRSADYVCKEGGKCEMDMWMRRKCQFCRLRRCREVGMREECLLSDEQCKARMSRRKVRPRQASRDVVKEEYEKQDSSPVSSVVSPVTTETGTDIIPQTTISDNPMTLICEKHRMLIEKLVTLQAKYELPSEEDAAEISALEVSGLQQAELMFAQMTLATLQTTKLVVEFAKELPSFPELQEEDKIAVLKGSASEVMMLRTARRYDLRTHCIIFSNNQPFTKDQLSFGGMEEFTDFMWPFCRSMAELHTDNAEFALITAITIFSERETVKNGKQMENIQEVYLETLRAYTKAKYQTISCNMNRFAKLLMKLTDLRTLSNEHLKVLKKLMIAQKHIPPLLQEYFNI
ncbi:ecdysone receptor-like [Lineus longissimus]|uniref:ecdysone receptor-like n=1 Tax=Lineus longissimus TaxID=88925 RepID=UPI002B4EEEDD